MVAMVRRPPEYALLRGSLGKEGHQELWHTGQLIRTVAEVAVVPGGNAEHAYQVCDHGEGNILPLEREEENTERANVQKEERHDRAKTVCAECLLHSR